MTQKIEPKPVTLKQLSKLDVMSAWEAAEKLGVHRSGITRYVDGGVLRAYTHMRRVYVLRAEVMKLKRVRDRVAESTDDGKRKTWKQAKRGALPRNVQ